MSPSEMRVLPGFGVFVRFLALSGKKSCAEDLSFTTYLF